MLASYANVSWNCDNDYDDDTVLNGCRPFHCYQNDFYSAYMQILSGVPLGGDLK